MHTMQAPAPRCNFKITGGSGGKPPQPNRYAGSQRVRQWGHSGGRLWAKWGHSYIVRFFTHSLLWAFSFSRIRPAHPLTLADAFVRFWNSAQRGLPLAPIPSRAVVDNFFAVGCLNFQQFAYRCKSMIPFNILLKRTKLFYFVCSTSGVMLSNAYVIYVFVCFKVFL